MCHLSKVRGEFGKFYEFGEFGEFNELGIRVLTTYSASSEFSDEPS